MGLRETLNDKPAVAAGIASTLVVITIVTAYFSLRGPPAVPDISSEKAFFTIDSGKTWFVDSVAKLPPFDHDGKEALRAFVYECDGKKFVAYVQRYTPEGKAATLALADAQRSGKPVEPSRGRPTPSPRQIMRPGDAAWVSDTDWAKATSILQVKCPNGGSGVPTAVEP